MDYQQVSASIGVLIGAGDYISGLLGAVLAYLIMDMPHLFPQLFSKRILKVDEVQQRPKEKVDN